LPLRPRLIRLLAAFACTVVPIVTGVSVGSIALRSSHWQVAELTPAGPAVSGSARRAASQTVATGPAGAFPHRLQDRPAPAGAAYPLPRGHARAASQP